MPSISSPAGFMRTTDDEIQRLRAEFLEMPGLRLTPRQVERLCGVEQTLCQLMLDLLVHERFLCLKADGHYARPTGEMIQGLQPAKANLRQAPSLIKAS
jgi:hypothetical protein